MLDSSGTEYSNGSPSSVCSDILSSVRLSPATLDEHEADTLREHEFVNVLSPWSSFGGAVMVRLSP